MARTNALYFGITISLIVMLAQCWTPEAEKDRVQELDGYMNFTGKF